MSLCGVATAGAATPTGGKTYGGGAIGPRYDANNHSDGVFVTLAPSADRRTVFVRAQVDRTCSISPGSIDIYLQGRLSPTGGFSISGPENGSGSGGSEVGTAQVSGRVISAERGIGTLSVDTNVKLNSGAQGTCSSGTRHFQVDLPGRRGERGPRHRGWRSSEPRTRSLGSAMPPCCSAFRPMGARSRSSPLRSWPSARVAQTSLSQSSCRPQQSRGTTPSEGPTRSALPWAGGSQRPWWPRSPAGLASDTSAVRSGCRRPCGTAVAGKPAHATPDSSITGLPDSTAPASPLPWTE